MSSDCYKFNNAARRPQLSLLDPETLGLKSSEKLLYDPAHLVPRNNLPCFAGAIN